MISKLLTLAVVALAIVAAPATAHMKTRWPRTRYNPYRFTVGNYVSSPRSSNPYTMDGCGSSPDNNQRGPIAHDLKEGDTFTLKLAIAVNHGGTVHYGRVRYQGLSNKVVDVERWGSRKIPPSEGVVISSPWITQQVTIPQGMACQHCAFYAFYETQPAGTPWWHACSDITIAPGSYSMTAQPTPTPTPAPTPKLCPTIPKRCPDGSVVYRDFYNGCRFPSCYSGTTPTPTPFSMTSGPNPYTPSPTPYYPTPTPTPDTYTCPSDVLTCPNGMVVFRQPSLSCRFPRCAGVRPPTPYTTPYTPTPYYPTPPPTPWNTPTPTPYSMTSGPNPYTPTPYTPTPYTTTPPPTPYYPTPPPTPGVNSGDTTPISQQGDLSRERAQSQCHKRCASQWPGMLVCASACFSSAMSSYGLYCQYDSMSSPAAAVDDTKRQRQAWSSGCAYGSAISRDTNCKSVCRSLYQDNMLSTFWEENCFSVCTLAERNVHHGTEMPDCASVCTSPWTGGDACWPGCAAAAGRAWRRQNM